MKSIKAYFESSSLVISILVDASTDGTYTKQFKSVGSIALTYQINASPASLPFTVSIGDTLEITASTTGYVELY